MDVLRQIKSDCAHHGYGRKKWWADKFGVPPLTFSHWLAGRQKPNGKHALLMKEILDQNESNKRRKTWKENLWDCYYAGESIPSKILSGIILEILSMSCLDSRTLALLSHFVEREKLTLTLEEPSSNRLKNRLGWLLEVSGQKAAFKPVRSPREILLPFSPGRPQLGKYLCRYQTAVGKKWRLYDCPLDQLKASLL